MRAIAAASALTATLALAGCAGASPQPAPAPYRTPAAQVSPTYAIPPPPLVPDTKTDREACSEFGAVLAGRVSRAAFADWVGNHDVRGRLLRPVTAWLAGTGGQGPVMTDCETIGGI